MELTRSATIVDRLQRTSAAAFKSVVSRLEESMSEVDIAEHLRLALAQEGISQYWYDAPLTVLIGPERFQIGTTTADYSVKNPSEISVLEDGSPVLVGLSPVDSDSGTWGGWATTVVFRPESEEDAEQVAFLQEVREIHRAGIARIRARTTGADVCKFYLRAFAEKGITLSDAGNNVGHSMHDVPKDIADIVLLDEYNEEPLGQGIYAIEPGGYRERADGSGMLVARFKECVYIPPNGHAWLLGETALRRLIV